MSATVAGLLVRDGRVLMGLRSASRRSYPGLWDAPGGHVEPGEAPDAALARELREELAVEVSAFHYLDTVMFREDGEPAPCRVYAVTAWDGEPRNACPEHDELRWFTPDELGRLPNFASPAYPGLARRALLLTGTG